MKRKVLFIILVLEAVILGLLSVFTKSFPTIFTSLLTFPFEQIAKVLLLLSKSGWFGNGIAVAIWFGISALPAIYAIGEIGERKKGPESMALFLLSGVIMLAMYGLMNPHVFVPNVPQDFTEFIKITKEVFCIAIWSTVILYAILRLIRQLKGGDKELLMKYLGRLLWILAMIFAALAVTSCTGLIAKITHYESVTDKVFAVIRMIADMVPYLFDLMLILGLLDLLDMIVKEEQEGIVEAASRVSSICYKMLVITITVTTVMNILQLAVMRFLSNVSASLVIPVTSLVFMLFILLFARLVIENKELRDDNSLFI